MPGTVMPVWYRVEQFVRALTAERAISEEGLAEVERVLCPGAWALFVRQAPQDQRHALAVYETLCRQGHTSKDLLAAALLHDVGKAAAQLGPWQRGALVLAERISPRFLDLIADGPPQDWRRSVAHYASHAEIGARWAEEVGCSPITVELTRRHEEQLGACRRREDRLLAALQAADRVN